MSGPHPSRRAALLAAISACGCAGALRAQAASDGADLSAAPALMLTPAEEERHGILLLLAMALLFDAWGVNRSSPTQLAAYANIAPGRRFPDYFGHNIGALLVDRNGGIICFALNRSVALNSTLAHAEARAVGAAIGFANGNRPKTATPAWSFGSLLQGDYLYGTLEPCAQCAGIMDLANLGGVVYAEDDPGQRGIVNVLYNLHDRTGQAGAPLPIRAAFLPLWEKLAASYRQFANTAPPGSRTGLTSFLQTVEAYRVYAMAARAFEALRAAHPENADILSEARAFRARWADRLRDDPLGIIPVPPASGPCPPDTTTNPRAVTRPAGPLGMPVCGAG